jgi:hypothetical protein
MRRLLFAVVIVGVVFSAGVSATQEEPPQMPEKVRGILDNITGMWSFDAGDEGKGMIEYKWNLGEDAIIGHAQYENGELSGSGTEFFYWDGISEDGLLASMSYSGDEGIGHEALAGKALSQALMEGKRTAVRAGKKVTAKFQVKFQGSDQFIWKETSIIIGGEKKPDVNVVHTRVKPTTREDFEEFCKLNEGAWVGKVPLRKDIPGVGKKGEMATAHYDYTIIEDGAALVGKSYWPGGTNTWFIAYDKENQQIQNIGISSVFGINNPTFRYSNRTWISKGADGTTSDNTVTGTFSDNGKILTVHVTKIENGEKSEFTDVWHRMNK